MEKSPVRSDAYFPEWKPALILIFAASRLYGQRGSISGSEAAQEKKRKRSIKFSTAGEDPENNGVFLNQNGGTLGTTERGEQYIALTEVTTPEALPGDGEGSPITQEDSEEASGSDEVNVEVDASGSQPEQCDEASNENQDSNEKVKCNLSYSRTSTCGIVCLLTYLVRDS